MTTIAEYCRQTRVQTALIAFILFETVLGIYYIVWADNELSKTIAVDLIYNGFIIPIFALTLKWLIGEIKRNKDLKIILMPLLLGVLSFAITITFHQIITNTIGHDPLHDFEFLQTGNLSPAVVMEFKLFQTFGIITISLLGTSSVLFMYELLKTPSR